MPSPRPQSCRLQVCLQNQNPHSAFYIICVTYGIAPRQYCEAKDGVGQAKHHAEGLEEADELVGDGVDPDDGDGKAGEGKGSVVGGRGGPRGERHDQSQEEGNIQS